MTRPTFLFCCLLPCLLLAQLGVVRGQPYYFTHYQVENGLSNNAVLCSVQDPMGFIWFGTKDGLTRFDGYTFKAFHHDPATPNGLGSNFIRALAVDRNGHIWAGTDQGIFIFNPRLETFSQFHPAVVNEVLDIQMDDQGNMWFINNLALYRVAADGELTQLTYAPATPVSSFSLTEAGEVWVGTTQGHMHRFQPPGGLGVGHSLFRHSPETNSNWIERIYDTGKGYLLIGTTAQGVKLFYPETGEYQDLLTHDGQGIDIFVRDIIANGNDEYWFATESGLFIYQLDSGQYVNLKKQRGNPWAISDNAVYTFCRDTEGGIWVGTYFGGVNHYTRNNTFFEKFFPMEGANAIRGNAVREICADAYGNLWIGTEDEGLNKLNLGTGHITHFQPTNHPQSITYTNIHGLLVTGDTLWVGTFEHGLDLLHIPTGKVVRRYNAKNEDEGLHHNFIFNIYQTKSGRILLATGNGLFEYVPQTATFKRAPNFPAHIFYTTLFEGADGTIWAGTWRDGLYYYNPNTRRGGAHIHDPHHAKSLSSNRVNRILEDSQGRLWVATEGGLCLLNDDETGFHRYGTQQGFPSNLILALLEDGQKNLWVTTSKGLVRFDPKSGQFRTFTKSNGLLSDQFNYNSAFKDKNGTLYFGSVKGLIRFDPSNLRDNDYQAPVYITGLQVNNQELAIDKKGSPLEQSITFTDRLQLTHQQSSFSIDFAALSFNSPEMTEYAYKMEGLDKQWTHIRTNRRVYFTKLAPGDYIFRVNVANSTGALTGKERELRITVLPPFWKSTAAYLLYALMAIGTTRYLIMRYHRGVRERNRRRMETLQHRKEEELYRAKIDFFTNVTHEIRTPLTLIRGPLEKVAKNTAGMPVVQRHLQTMERNTERLLELTNQLLDFRQTEAESYQLHFSQVDINELLEQNLQNFRFAAEQKRLRLQVQLLPEPCWVSIDREAVTKIISNLLANALKYAERHIHVSLERQPPGENTFSLTVKNDGHLIPTYMREKIFESFVRLKATDSQGGSGLGLALARSLAMLHNGALQLKSPEDGMNVFVLTIPLMQPASQTT